MQRWRLLLALLLVLSAAAVSALLLLEHHGEGGALVAQVCGEGPASGCETVSASAWSAVAGVPLAALGLVFYGSVAALLVLAAVAGAELSLAAAALALLALAFGLAVDLFLLGVQAFAIHAYCRLCLATYVLGGLALALLLPARRLREALPGARRPEVPLLAAGWLLATAAVAGGVVVAELALAEREAERAASVLGSGPALLAPPRPLPSPATPEEALQAARAEAARLQAILDDPGLLEQYFEQKAAEQFEQAPVLSFRPAGPVLGPAEAPVQVVVFSDFLCPFCRNVASGLGAFVPQTEGRVAVRFKHLPLDRACHPRISRSVHEGSCALALGGVCAQEQGRFWPFHDRAFARPVPRATTADLARVAAEAGLDVPAFQRCLASPAAKAALDADIAEAVAASVSATPTLFVNGRQLPRANDLVAMVDRELARKGLPPLPRPTPPPQR